MAINYDLNNTGPEVQARLDQVFPNEEAIRQETANRETADDIMFSDLKNYTDIETERAKREEELLYSQLDGKADKADVVDNLSTNDPNKILSASQGVVLKTEIDENKEKIFKNTRDIASHEEAIELQGLEIESCAAGIEDLRNVYASLSQSDIVPVTSLPATGEPNIIYRLAGDGYYSDYMYNASNLTSPVLLATYNNAIDDKPTAGSNNLVKSGGVANAIGNIYTSVNQATVVRHQNGQAESDPNGTRVSIMFDCTKGTIFRFFSTSDDSCSISIYPTQTDALMNTNRFVIIKSTGAHYTSDYRCNYDGVISARFAKQDDTSYSDIEMQALLNSISLEVRGGAYGEMIADDELTDHAVLNILGTNIKNVPFASVKDAAFGRWAFGYDNYTQAAGIRRTMTGTFGNKDVGVGNRLKLAFFVPTDASVKINTTDYEFLVAKFATIEDAFTFGSDTPAADYIGGTEYSTGDKEGFTSGSCCIGIVLKKSDGTNITDAQITAMLSDIDIDIYPLKHSETVSFVEADVPVRVSTSDRRMYFPSIGYAGSVLFVDTNGGKYSLKGRSVGLSKSDIGTSARKPKCWLIYNTQDDQLKVRQITTYTIGRFDVIIGSLALSYDGNNLKEVYNLDLPFSVEIDGKPYMATDNNHVSIYLDTILQGSYDEKGWIGDDDNLKRVCTACVLAIPYSECTFEFSLPDDWRIGMRHGAKADQLNTNSYWFYDRETFTFPATSRYYILALAKYDGNDYLDITAEEVRSLIDDGEIRITYKLKGDDVIRSNYECEKYAKAVRRIFTGTSPNANNANPLRLPLFMHTSDVHGDYIRFKRFMEYADYMQVDAALVTGDLVGYTGANRCDFIQDVIDRSSTPGFICVGNHDAYEANSTHEALYNNVMKRNIDANSAVVPEISYPTYYYKDLTDKKIRIIALNSYDGGFNHSTSCYYTQDQIDWFIGSLVSTPADYGVIVLFHSPEAAIQKDNSYPKFYQDSVTYANYQSANITNRPIAAIVDAFVSGVTLNMTFSETNYANDPTTTDVITVEADFTGKASGVEFLFFACGHEHCDRVGYVSGTTNRLLVLDVTCGVGIYSPTYYKLAAISDLPRGDEGATQDSFNFYAVDRDTHTVRIARIGSNMPSSLNVRDFEAIPYA